MMFFKNMNSMVQPPEAETDLFENVTGDLQGDTLGLFSIFNQPTLRTKNVDRYERIWSHKKKQEADDIMPKVSRMQIAYVTIPPRPPEYINFFKPFHFLAGDQQVVPIGASHISS